MGRANLNSDPLISFLADKRDFVVHRGMFVPGSIGVIGITEGRGIKAGLVRPIDPLRDSDEVMQAYLLSVKEYGDTFGFLQPDEESLPCVRRLWKIPPFDEEVLDLAAQAWLRVGELACAVIRWLGSEPPQLSLNCRHSSQQVQVKVYEREALEKWMKELPNGGL